MNQSRENLRRDGRMDGRMDGQTIFYRTLLAETGGPIRNSTLKMLDEGVPEFLLGP